jgi:DNA-binding response OmpR family regulator
MRSLLIFEDENQTDRTWIRKLRDQSEEAGVRFRQATSVDGLESELASQAADVVLVDVSGGRTGRVELLSQVRAQHPGVRTLLVVDARTCSAGSVQNLLASPSVDFVRVPVDTREVWQRVQKLARSAMEPGTPNRAAEETVRPDGRQRVGKVVPAPARRRRMGSRVRSHLLPPLRNPNGRLDAKRVARLFGMPLAEVARILHRQASTMHKTPDAPSLQQPLALFERIAVALLPLAGSEEGFRMWMNAPSPDLGGLAPMELLKRGQGEIVAELLEDALVGQPG